MKYILHLNSEQVILNMSYSHMECSLTDNTIIEIYLDKWASKSDTHTSQIYWHTPL